MQCFAGDINRVVESKTSINSLFFLNPNVDTSEPKPNLVLNFYEALKLNR